MRRLLIFASFAEGGFGLLLLAAPAVIVSLLFRGELAGAGAIMARLAGLALVSLAVACWPEEGAVRPYYGMLTWSAFAAVGLIGLGIAGFAGILLWPAVAVHVSIVLLLVRARAREQKTAT